MVGAGVVEEASDTVVRREVSSLFIRTLLLAKSRHALRSFSKTGGESVIRIKMSSLA